jgi:hypothetical protein
VRDGAVNDLEFLDKGKQLAGATGAKHVTLWTLPPK